MNNDLIKSELYFILYSIFFFTFLHSFLIPSLIFCVINSSQQYLYLCTKVNLIICCARPKGCTVKHDTLLSTIVIFVSRVISICITYKIRVRNCRHQNKSNPSMKNFYKTPFEFRKLLVYLYLNAL